MTVDEICEKYQDVDSLPCCQMLAMALTEYGQKLEAERDALREAARWIPVGERLPEEGELVLAWHKEKPAFRYQLDFEYRAGFATNTIYFRERITHWHPLPEPPQQEVEG